MLGILGHYNTVLYRKYYFIILFMSSIVVYLKMFKDLHHEVKGAAWHTMPATIMEKLISRILIGTVVLMVIVMAIVFLSSLLSEGINLLLFGSRHEFFNPIGAGIIQKTVGYFIILSPVFLGAIYFKKYALFKTFLIIALYLLLVIIMVFLTLKGLFYAWFDDLLFGFDPTGNLNAFLSHLNKAEPMWTITKWVVKSICWWFLAPICWIVGYFRLKETEI
jgi:hypothetical protein